MPPSYNHTHSLSSLSPASGLPIFLSILMNGAKDNLRTHRTDLGEIFRQLLRRTRQAGGTEWNREGDAQRRSAGHSTPVTGSCEGDSERVGSPGDIFQEPAEPTESSAAPQRNQREQNRGHPAACEKQQPEGRPSPT